MAIQNTSLSTAAVTVTNAMTITNGGLLTLDRANGITIILPPATGSGNRYTFVVNTLLNAGSFYTWQVNTPATEILDGKAVIQPGNLGEAQVFFTPLGCNAMEFDGLGRGGQLFDSVGLIDTKVGQWNVFVEANTPVANTPKTPFFVYVPAPPAPPQPVQTNPVLHATKTLTAASYILDQSYNLNNYAVLFLENQAGILLTLPAATGSGDIYNFVVSQAPNNSAYIFQPVNSNTDNFQGVGIVEEGTALFYKQFFAPHVCNAFEFDGQSRGGQIGDIVRFTDIGSHEWDVFYIARTSGVDPGIPYFLTSTVPAP